MAHQKPREQLFDLQADPHDIHDLAGSPAHQEALQRMRGVLNQWMVDIRDLGFMPEPQWFTRFEDLGDTRPRRTIAHQSPEAYPLDRLMAIADTVGLGSEVVDAQIRALADPDPAVRYWAVQGLWAQDSLDSSATEVLARLLEDAEPTCRIAASVALGRHGSHSESLPVLVELLDHPQFYVALLAANSLEQLGAAAEPIADRLQAYVDRDETTGPRREDGQRKCLDTIVTSALEAARS
jgi:HEAT repeat protein